MKREWIINFFEEESHQVTVNAVDEKAALKKAGINKTHRITCVSNRPGRPSIIDVAEN